jgi:hypothetical protein
LFQENSAGEAKLLRLWHPATACLRSDLETRRNDPEAQGPAAFGQGFHPRSFQPGLEPAQDLHSLDM